MYLVPTVRKDKKRMEQVRTEGVVRPESRFAGRWRELQDKRRGQVIGLFPKLAGLLILVLAALVLKFFPLSL